MTRDRPCGCPFRCAFVLQEREAKNRVSGPRHLPEHRHAIELVIIFVVSTRPQEVHRRPTLGRPQNDAIRDFSRATWEILRGSAVTADLDGVAIIITLRECFLWQLRICLTVRSHGDHDSPRSVVEPCVECVLGGGAHSIHNCARPAIKHQIDCSLIWLAL